MCGESSSVDAETVDSGNKDRYLNCWKVMLLGTFLMWTRQVCFTTFF
jgi:hypothetical protein